MHPASCTTFACPLGWNSVRLAEAAGIGKATVWRLESMDGPLGGEPETVAKIIGALEDAGVEFLNGDSSGVRLRPDPKPPTAASKAAAAKKAAKPRRPAKSGKT